MIARNDEVLLAKLNVVMRMNGEVTHRASAVYAWRNYGIVCPGRVTTNGNAAMAAGACGRAFWHAEADFFVMRFESCHPLVPMYPNALIDVWQGFVDAYYAAFPEEARYAGNMAERRARAETYLAGYLRGE